MQRRDGSFIPSRPLGVATAYPHGWQARRIVSSFVRKLWSHANKVTSEDIWSTVVFCRNETALVQLISRLIKQSDSRVRPGVYGMTFYFLSRGVRGETRPKLNSDMLNNQSKDKMRYVDIGYWKTPCWRMRKWNTFRFSDEKCYSVNGSAHARNSSIDIYSLKWV